jgi:X-X-X-Leu-X-X-Gly heptad repeat protein
MVLHRRGEKGTSPESVTVSINQDPFSKPLRLRQYIAPAAPSPVAKPRQGRRAAIRCWRASRQLASGSDGISAGAGELASKANMRLGRSGRIDRARVADPVHLYRELRILRTVEVDGDADI